MKKTETQKLNEKNAAAVRKQREAVKETNRLHKLVDAGKLTAGQALRIKAGLEEEPLS